jgi:hypothetical protein
MNQTIAYFSECLRQLYLAKWFMVLISRKHPELPIISPQKGKKKIIVNYVFFSTLCSPDYCNNSTVYFFSPCSAYESDFACLISQHNHVWQWSHKIDLQAVLLLKDKPDIILGPSYEFAFLFLTCTLAPSVSK